MVEAYRVNYDKLKPLTRRRAHTAPERVISIL